MRLRNVTIAFVLLFVASTLSVTAAIRGRVTDVGAKDARTAGIGGVEVAVYDADRKCLAKVSTDALGRYEVNAPLPGTVDLVFTMLGYQSRPTEELNIPTAGDTTVDVGMIQETATEAYNRILANRIADADPLMQARHQKVIDKLPKEQCEFVRAAIHDLRLAPAQKTKVIGGTISTDGYPLPGVTVNLVETEACAPCPTCSYKSRILRAAVTDADGGYSIPSIPPGAYVVHAELSGLRDARSNVRLEDMTGATVTRDLTMQFEAISETITVTAEAPTIDIIGAAPDQPVVVLPKKCRDFSCIVGNTAIASNADGRVTTYLPAGTYEVVVPNRNTPPTSRTFVVHTNQSMTIDVSPPH